mmetsp:Transcript_43136/g.112260  ORF Transcript_43136/g.112260 Transcript_43136/m.112260 type:complete len:248 (-) Transcript_43136:7-750(-)
MHLICSWPSDPNFGERPRNYTHPPAIQHVQSPLRTIATINTCRLAAMLALQISMRHPLCQVAGFSPNVPRLPTWRCTHALSLVVGIGIATARVATVGVATTVATTTPIAAVGVATRIDMVTTRTTTTGVLVSVPIWRCVNSTSVSIADIARAILVVIAVRTIAVALVMITLSIVTAVLRVSVSVSMRRGIDSTSAGVVDIARAIMAAIAVTAIVVARVTITLIVVSASVQSGAFELRRDHISRAILR